MGNSSEARVLVVFGPAALAGPGDAVLIEGAAIGPDGVSAGRFLPAGPARAGHPSGCACCVPRSGAAEAMRALFLTRARASDGPFRRLVVAASPAGEAAVRQALAEDLFLRGRYWCLG